MSFAESGEPEVRPATAPSVEGAAGDARRELLALGVGALLAAALLVATVGGREQDFEELALGKETTSLYAAVDGLPVHCKDLSDAQACLDAHAARGGRPAALWLGNSQVHAVNQLRPDEENAPPRLFRRLGERGLELVTFSQPNANLQEHWVLFEWLRARLPLRALILPVVFDDLREIGIRATLADALRDPATLEALHRHEVGRRILESRDGEPKGDLAALDQTVQERSELALNGWLDAHWELWALRPQARGTLFSNLYLARNTLLGITAQSKRRMIPGRRDQNLAAGAALLQEARAGGVQTLVYVVPLRGDVETPYVEREYQRFKEEIEALAAAQGAAFLNLEDLVPAPLWGAKRATDLDGTTELDFMHFQAGGHALLAEALGDALEPRLAGRRP